MEAIPRLRTPEALKPRERKDMGTETPMVEIEHLNFYYDGKIAVKDVTITFPKARIAALIGPSGCGKSTLLRCLNRMNELIDGVSHEGTIRISGLDIYDHAHDVTELR